MAKKKKVDIVRKLNDLNPSIPTRTRTRKSDIKNDPEPEESMNAEKIQAPFEILSFFHENMSAMEKLRKSMLEDTMRFQHLFFGSFTNIMKILFDTMHTNMNFASNLFRRIQR
jgi:hypothetical protein